MDMKTMTVGELIKLKNTVEEEIETRDNAQRAKDLEVAEREYEEWMAKLQNTLEKIDVSAVLRILEACDMAAFLHTVKSYINIPDEEITWDMVTWNTLEMVFRDELEPHIHYPRFDPHGEYKAFFDVAVILSEIGGVK